MEDLSDIFAAEEARRIAEAKAEQAAADKAWSELTPEQQEEEIAKAEAKWDALRHEARDLDEDCDDEDEWDEEGEDE